MTGAATSKMTLSFHPTPSYEPAQPANSAQQQSPSHPNHLLHPLTGSHFDNHQPDRLHPGHHHTNSFPSPTLGHNPGNQTQCTMMMSQASAHQFDSHLTQQPTHYAHHHRQSSSVSSLGSGAYDPINYSQPNSVHDSFALPNSFSGSVSAGTAFGGVPVSAESYHQYSSSHHQRSSSTSSASSPYTEPTSISEGSSPEGCNGVPGGRKVSQAQILRRARSQASPYAIRTDGLSWNGVDHSSASTSSSSLDRSSSVVSDVTSSTEEEIAELLRSQSRESSVSDWNSNGLKSQSQGSAPLPHQTGLGSAGAFMDPYAAVANVHGHVGAFGPTMVSLGNASSNNLVAGGLVGMNGISNPSLVGGMGAQMGRMTLDNTETYEALAHHIRTAVTTSAADRARQAFVQAWLNSSYISYTDGNVSRQGLYGSYLRICQQYDIKPINSASFGKAVRQSFPNIKTRRLGVRGNSKYHYCGIRPATAKEADILMNLSRNEQPEPNGTRASSSVDEDDSDDSGSRRVSLQPVSSDDQLGMMGFDGDDAQPQTPKTARPTLNSFSSQDDSLNSMGLKNGETSRGLEPVPFPNLEESLNQPNAHDVDHQKAREFWAMYTDHSKTLLDAVKSYRFDQFELNLRTFWASLDPSNRECVTHPVLTSLVYRADAVLYDRILDFLHTQTLLQMPQQAFGSLRQLAQNMEQVIIVAMENYPNTFVGPKIELAARFGHLIDRHLGICQLAQALSGVFSNPNSVKDMAEAWDGIDFEAVRNQAALVTNCHHDTLGYCFDQFRQILFSPGASIEHFISFVESTYERCLQPTATGERGLSPRSLLVRWCFVSAQLIRDLTLRSASSFGSFQIVNLFFDEWLGFKVLRKVALHVAAVAASVDATSGDVTQQQLDLQGVPGAMLYAQQATSFSNYNSTDADGANQPADSVKSSHNISGSGNSGGSDADDCIFPSDTQSLSHTHQPNLSASGSPNLIQLTPGHNNYDSTTPVASIQPSPCHLGVVQEGASARGSALSSNHSTEHVILSKDDTISVSMVSNLSEDDAFNELVDASGFGMSINNSAHDDTLTLTVAHGLNQ